MRFDLKRPCAGCPYTRGDKAVRLPERRTAQLIAYMTDEPGKTFPCHKTGGVDEQFCAGALLFAEKQESPPNMIRMAKGLGLYKSEEMSGQENVFDSAEEMLKSAL